MERPDDTSAPAQRGSFKNAPDVYKAMSALQAAANGAGLDPTLLELVKIRSSQINKCAFCIHMHVADAKKRGETDTRLHLVAAWEEAPVFTARERAALRWTEAITCLSDGHGVPDAVYEEAREHFDEAGLYALTLNIVAINGWNRFQVAFRVPPQV